jgi:phosphatidylserine/phosphatidylglycerophosphate/cardiolipin synthase-like enzyme
MRRCAALLVFVCLPLLAPASAEALDYLCDTRKDLDCRNRLLTMINNEPADGGIDVAFWFMTDDRYRSALKNAHDRGVRVRVLVDPRANASKPGNVQILENLKLAGIPMRQKVKRSWGDILHWKIMLFEKGNTQTPGPIVEFSAANYSPDSFVPFVQYQNYIDEVVYITDDRRLTGSFAKRFEDYWTDTSGSFTDYANMTAADRGRYYPEVTQDPALNFPPTQDYASRAIGDYDREPAGVNGGKIDVIMYRMSDRRHADAMIRAVNRGIPVRLITEQENYRDGRYIWHAFNADQMWAAGVDVKDHVNGKAGITHQKSVILYGRKEVIFGSSNWSSASSNQQLEHNIFSKPCIAGQVTWCDGPRSDGKPANWFFNFFVKQFNDKWNSVNPTEFVEFKPFIPRPGGTPVNFAPANGATGVGSSAVLNWDGGNWNHKYDVYVGLSPTLTEADKKASNIIVGSPYTGERESWTATNLQPGRTYYWRVVGKTMADSPRSAAAGLNLAKPGPTWAFTTAGTASAGSTAYGGTPVALPGTIQVENFDTGASGVSYSDTTSGNSGGAYRATNVDIAVCSDTGGGYNLGYTRPGEWLKYTVNVTTSGTYTLTVRYANQGTGATFRVEVDGQDKTGPLALQDTGGWQKWQNIQKTGIALTAGIHVVRLFLDRPASPNGAVGNYNYLTFSTGTSAASLPYGGAPAALPGIIEAENFDNGGQSVAYHDTTPGNSGGQYRKTDHVDVATATDTGGGFNLGYTRAGEWLKYTVNVIATGTYTLRLRYANVGSGARLHMEVDGTDKSGPMLLQNTGGWQSWRDLVLTGISLARGTHIVKLMFDAANVQNTAVGNINRLSFSSS